MKILILALLVLGAAAWPDRRGTGPRDRPSRPPFRQPPRPGGARPPFRPGGFLPPFDKGPMGGAGEDWIPPFDDPDLDFGLGMDEDEGMRPTGKPPCRRRPGGPNGGDPETEPEGPTPGAGEGNRGDRLPRRIPGVEARSDRPRRPGQGVRQGPGRPARGERRRRPKGEARLEKPKGRRIKPFKGKKLNPEDMENRQFFPIFSAANVTIQNATDIPLKEGDNAFLLPVGPRRLPPPGKAGENAPEELFGYGGFGYGGLVPYLNLKYNPSATPTVSFEYGVTQFLG